LVRLLTTVIVGHVNLRKIVSANDKSRWSVCIFHAKDTKIPKQVLMNTIPHGLVMWSGVKKSIIAKSIIDKCFPELCELIVFFAKRKRDLSRVLIVTSTTSWGWISAKRLV
jgi:hypothetical protein